MSELKKFQGCRDHTCDVCPPYVGKPIGWACYECDIFIDIDEVSRPIDFEKKGNTLWTLVILNHYKCPRCGK